MKAGKVIKKMRLEKHSVLAVKKGSEIADTEEQRAELSEAIMRIIGHPLLIITVNNLDDVELIGKWQMGQYGWFRFPGVDKIEQDILEGEVKVVKEGEEDDDA